MTGGTICSVASCKSNAKNAKGENLMFFTFPKDLRVRKEWVSKCYRTDKWSADNKRICSRHFRPEDFADEMKARLMNFVPRKLRKDAIPSLFLLTKEQQLEISERSKRMLTKENKSIDSDPNTSTVTTPLETISDKFQLTNMKPYISSSFVLTTEQQLEISERSKRTLTKENESIVSDLNTSTVTTPLETISDKFQLTNMEPDIPSLFGLTTEQLKISESSNKMLTKENKSIVSDQINSTETTPLTTISDKFQLTNMEPAIPSFFVLTTEQQLEISERSKRTLTKENKSIVSDLLNTSTVTTPPLKTISDKFQLNNAEPSIEGSMETCYDVLKKKIKSLQNENVILKQKISDQENNEKILRQHLAEVENQLKDERVQFKEKAKVAFKDFLTSNQIEIALKNKSKARWTTEELTRAFTLLYFSKRSYLYLRDTLHYPLPGLSTLQQWASNTSRSGILEDIE